MSLSPSETQQLLTTFDDLREGQASDEQLDILCAAVIGSRDARQLYLQHAFLATSLRWAYSGSLVKGGSESRSSENSRSPAVTRFISQGHPQSWLRRLTPKLVGIAASLLVAGYFLGVGGLLVWDRMQRMLAQNDPANIEQPSVATLISTSECRWEGNDELTAGAELPQRVIRLKSGIAELRFADGAKVVLQGPARFETLSSGRGFLSEGQLSAYVPQTAVGFRIDTPNASIIDLGTEFEVATNAKSGTQVQVLKGKVDVRQNVAEGDLKSASQSRRLIAGQAVRIVANDGGIPVIEPTGAAGQRLVPPPSRADNHFADGDIVADYRRDFHAFDKFSSEQQIVQKFPANWQFFWNASGPIGEPRQYEALSWNRKLHRFLPSGSTFDGDRNVTETSKMRFAHFFSQGGHPGPGVIQSAQPNAAADRYVIACVTLTEPGRYAIANSSIESIRPPTGEQPYSPGVQLLVLVNNVREPRKSLVVEPLKAAATFDLALGKLSAGDKIWIAVGPRGVDANDMFSWNFQIIRQSKVNTSP